MHSDRLFGIPKEALRDPQGVRKRKIKEIQKSKEREVKEERSRIEDLQKIMSTPEGRRFMWSLLEMAGVFSLSYTGNADTHFNEGRRSLGLVYMADLHAHMSDLYTEMVTEVQIRQERNDG